MLFIIILGGTEVKVINPEARLFEESTRLKHIEACGRLCYKSEDKITATSAERFVLGLVKSKHLAMIEHATYSVHIPAALVQLTHFQNQPYLTVTECRSGKAYLVSGNARAWRMLLSGWSLPKVLRFDICFALYKEDPEAYMVLFNDLVTAQAHWQEFNTEHNHYTTYVVDEEEIMYTLGLSRAEMRYHIYRTVLFICDRGVSHELVRHRPASFAQESTRYCNYKEEMVFIRPSFFRFDDIQYALWETEMKHVEETYTAMIQHGATPQQARTVLPNSLKTEIVVTANIHEWLWIESLRDAKSAHPQIQEVIQPAMRQIKRSLDYGEY